MPVRHTSGVCTLAKDLLGVGQSIPITNHSIGNAHSRLTRASMETVYWAPGRLLTSTTRLHLGRKFGWEANRQSAYEPFFSALLTFWVYVQGRLWLPTYVDSRLEVLSLFSLLSRAFLSRTSPRICQYSSATHHLLSFSVPKIFHRLHQQQLHS